MNILLIVLISCLIVLSIAILTILIFKNKRNSPESLNAYSNLSDKIERNFHSMETNLSKDLVSSVQDSMLRTINTSLNTINHDIAIRLAGLEDKVNKNISAGYDRTNNSFTAISNKMETLKETINRVDNLNQSVISLNRVLTNNQTRGQFGERILENILFDVFGDTKDLYEMQKTYKIGRNEKDVKPDAVIHMPEYDIFIDSKYPFSNFREIIDDCCMTSLIDHDTKQQFANKIKPFIDDVKKHIKKISEDYILPGITAEQAIMFLPNDGVYTFIQSRLYEELVVYASKCKVVITSPATLQPILYTLTSLRLNYYRIKNGKSILDSLAALNKSFESLKKEWQGITDDINRLAKHQTSVSTKIDSFDKTFKKYTDGNIEERIESKDLEEELV